MIPTIRCRSRCGVINRTLFVLIALALLLALSTNAAAGVVDVLGKRSNNEEIELTSMPELADVDKAVDDKALGMSSSSSRSSSISSRSRSSSNSFFSRSYNNSIRSGNNVHLRRRLQAKDYELPDIYGGIHSSSSSSSSSSGSSSSSSSNNKRIRSKREMKRSAYKYEKLKQAVSKIESLKTPESVKPEPWCRYVYMFKLRASYDNVVNM